MASQENKTPASVQSEAGVLTNGETSTTPWQEFKALRRIAQVFEDDLIDRSTTKVVLIQLARAMDEQDEVAITLKDITESLKPLSKRAISSALKQAEDLGYIEIRSHAATIKGEKNTTTTNVYVAKASWPPDDGE